MKAAYGISLPFAVRDVADEGAESDAEREQVEDRLEESGEHDDQFVLLVAIRPR